MVSKGCSIQIYSVRKQGEDRYLRKGLYRCMCHFQGNTKDSSCKSLWCTVIWATRHSFLARSKPTQQESKENITLKEDRKLDTWQTHAFPYIIDRSSRIMSIKKGTKVCYQQNRKRWSQVDSQASLYALFCAKMDGARLSWIAAFQSSSYQVHMNREFIYLCDHRTRASIFPYIYTKQHCP